MVAASSSLECLGVVYSCVDARFFVLCVEFADLALRNHCEAVSQAIIHASRAANVLGFALPWTVLSSAGVSSILKRHESRTISASTTLLSASDTHCKMRSEPTQNLVRLAKAKGHGELLHELSILLRSLSAHLDDSVDLLRIAFFYAIETVERSVLSVEWVEEWLIGDNAYMRRVRRLETVGAMQNKFLIGARR